MSHEPFPAKTSFLTGAPILISLALLLGSTGAQTPNKTSQPRSGAQTNAPTNVPQELVRIETGFFEAWKTKDQTYLRSSSGLFSGKAA